MQEGDDHERAQALNAFFISVQVKALRQIEFAVKNRDDAFDILQDAMEKLAKNYADKPNEWAPLFQRILQNTLYDWYRKQKIKQLFKFSSSIDDEEIEAETCQQVVADNPERSAMAANDMAVAKRALAQLPIRQQQAFILRAWWGHNIAETAYAMNCSEGSVKTHYSRARSRLQALLENRGEV